MVYLFIGEDPLSKDIQIKRIRNEFLNKSTEQFNLDILYAKELNLKDLQEKLFYFPVKSSQRIIAINEAQNLKDDLKEFLLQYAKTPSKQVILILNINTLSPSRKSSGQYGKTDEFINRVSRYAKVCRFKETKPLDAFALGRSIALKKLDYALRILNQLLKDGERPERILGGLRYAWERDTVDSLEAKRRLKILLNCDIDIKTGRLKPAFALEKLVISLCGLGKSFH